MDQTDINSAQYFLPEKRLTEAELKYILKKLKFESRKRLLAVQEWFRERRAEAKHGIMNLRERGIIKRRAETRVKYAKFLLKPNMEKMKNYK